jgi:hypothetical protein
MAAASGKWVFASVVSETAVPSAVSLGGHRGDGDAGQPALKLDRFPNDHAGPGAGE